MATYQGEPFLEAQLASIANQTHRNWTLTISDDGSTDATLQICANFALAHADKVQILQGPRSGATANFFHLVNSVRAAEADFYAFSDQDDIWSPPKLTSALNAIHHLKAAPNQPLLYCGRTRIVDQHLNPVGYSPTPRRPLGFGNAVVQNVVNGNTMLFNFSLLHLLRQINPKHAVLHDWTAYLATTGCGGQICFDATPQILYRQHAQNVVGSQNRLRDKFTRLRRIFKGCYRTWGDQTEATMEDLLPYMSESARHQLHTFKRMRQEKSPIARIRAGWKSGLWRQTTSGQLSFFLALACRQL